MSRKVVVDNLPNSKVWEHGLQQLFLSSCPQLAGHLFDAKLPSGLLFWRVINIQSETTVELSLNLASIFQVRGRVCGPSGLLFFRVVIVLAVRASELGGKIRRDPGGTSDMDVDFLHSVDDSGKDLDATAAIADDGHCFSVQVTLRIYWPSCRVKQLALKCGSICHVGPFPVVEETGAVDQDVTFSVECGLSLALRDAWAGNHKISTVSLAYGDSPRLPVLEPSGICHFVPGLDVSTETMLICY